MDCTDTATPRIAAVIGGDPEGITGRRAKPETMAQLTASRTLVKSRPELWAECSDAAALARHLGAFGGIQITKLEPETAVAWEGEDVRGTVTLEPSGWGTRVVLTAVPQPGVDAGTTRRGFWRRRFGGRRQAMPPVRKAIEPEPPPSEPAPAALLEALDSLGRAHHRPYSRG